MNLVVDTNQLSGHPDVVSIAPHAAFQHIIHSQFPSYLRH